MNGAVLAINAGSSSLKVGLFDVAGPDPKPILRGSVEDKAEAPRLTLKGPDGEVLEDRLWHEGADHAEMLDATLDWMERHHDVGPLAAVGHRVVHGGERFTGPVRLDDETVTAIEALISLAPLHQPRSLEAIHALRKLRPSLLQVACFDTAFHRTMTPPATRYAIPRRFEREGVRKYGFHGLSYEYVAGRLAGIDPALPGKRTVVAHLGNGASLCAMRHGRSLDTTMGFSALDGLVMGTRPGALDPGVVLYLQREHGMNAEAVERMLYHGSGLLGVSEISGDMRALVGSDDPRAKEAIELFAFRVARETAALANTLEGIEAVIFTGGIGEHSSGVRAAICGCLKWLGLDLDVEANALRSALISRRSSRVVARVVATDEEVVIARHVRAALGCNDGTA